MKPSAVAAAVVEKDGKFLLVKEVLENNKEYWIIPGGGVEFGETLEQAAVREIKEETNLDIKIVRFIGYKEVVRTEFNYHAIIFFFLARPAGGELILGDKAIDGKFFTPAEIKELSLVDSARWLFESGIRDGPRD